MTRSGMISILGRPNVGKSTLFNALVGEKVSIVTDKPQTTRRRVCGVLNLDGAQLVFVDTPGFHKPRTALGRYMTDTAAVSAGDADCALLLIEPIAHVGTQESLLLERVKKSGVPCILVVNKIDTVPKEQLLPVISEYGKAYDFRAIVPVCAATKDGLDILINELRPLIPEGPQLFPDGMTSDQAETAFITEIIREKLLETLEQEVPHGIAVVADSVEKRGLIEINATVYCEKASHKGIIIGKDGALLGRAGKLARVELERLLGQKVLLKLWVKVKENWRDDPARLRSFGYGDV
ncbi:MAG: GTPase Era [Oscillospiraceae bacterium]|nr:GTPase Era [Oscillospiraceae bacterium]